VRVASGLLRELNPTRGELAALLGHEMGHHVLHRHSMAKILKQLVLADVLEAVVGGFVSGPTKTATQSSFGRSLGSVLLRSAQWLANQKFSRQDEYQADGVAWELLLASDAYNPHSVISLLSKLEGEEERRHPDEAVATSNAAASSKETGISSSRGIAGAIEGWTSTHPATSDRLEALQKKWNELPGEERQRLQKRHGY
jgi:Zn-dependent protease with chaperone function